MPDENIVVLASEFSIFSKEEMASMMDRNDLEECPECEMVSVVVDGHCRTCYLCGWSACSL